MIGLSGVKIDFVEATTTIEALSKVDATTMVKGSSGKITYPNISTDKIGEYTIEFVVTNDNGYAKTFKHNIKVVDTTLPVINLQTMTVVCDTLPNLKEVLKGESQDNYDGLVETKFEGQVKDKPGIYQVRYYAKDSSNNTAEAIVYYFYQLTPDTMEEPFAIDGIIVVNKKIPLPKEYGTSRDDSASIMMSNMLQEAKKQGFDLMENSVFRDYYSQEALYEEKAKTSSKKDLDSTTARPGYSEHQTGLAFDIIDRDGTNPSNKAYKWLAENCAGYGFILRYPNGKEDSTGYEYEPWHFRYVGAISAKEIMENDLTLEQYLKLEN